MSTSSSTTAVVQAHGDVAGFHVLAADDEHRVDAQLFRVGNLRLEQRGAEIRIRADLIGAEFVQDGLGVVNQRHVVVERDDAHLMCAGTSRPASAPLRSKPLGGFSH
jgi:hypothetical protein